MDILNQFGINPVLLAAQVVNFLVLFFILKKLLYGPVLKVLAERKKRIEDSLKNADLIEKRLLETEEAIDKKLAKASLEAQKIVDEAKKSATEIVDEARQKATDDALLILAKNQEELKSEKEKMLVEVKTEVSDLVAAVLGKVTGKVITKDDQKKIIESEVKNLS